MENIMNEIKEQLMMKGYNEFSEPETHEEDGTTIFTATGDEKIVYVKILEQGASLAFDVQEASLVEAQYHETAPDFIWATNGEINYYADCIESEPLSEIPAVIDVTKKEKRELTEREKWSRKIYESLQKRFDDLHERLYGPAGADNISTTNEAIDELSKLLFMEIFRHHHRDYILQQGENAGTLFFDILDHKYIKENSEKAVKQIREAFKEIKNHEDYIAVNDQGEKHYIFSEDEYIRLQNPANFVTVFETIQDLGFFEDENGNEKKAVLTDISADILGRIFDVLMRGKYDNKSGQATYLTPREVTEAMIEMVMHDLTSDPNQAKKLIDADENGIPKFRMLDPTCGSAGFLIKGYEAVRKYILSEFTGTAREKMEKHFELMKEHSFVGADKTRNMILKARLNMAMHGLPRAPIFWVSDSLMTKSLEPESYDLIVTNPPFGSGSVSNKTEEGETILERFMEGIDEDRKPMKKGLCLGAKPDNKGKWKQVNSIDQAVLFIERNLELLKPGGQLIIVLPDGILSNSSYKYVREYLIGSKNEVTNEYEGGKATCIAVVSLPTITFQLSGTGAKTSFLYLKKKEHENEKQGPVFMAVADEIGFDVRNKHEVQLGNDRNDLLKIVEAYKKGL